MNNLVIMKDQQAVTSSLQVAEIFEKNHKDVMRAINDKVHSAQNCAQYKSMFVEGTYKDKSGKSNKLFYMNRDGFSFIVMGFTGRKADSFKLKYIEAFNAMEATLKQNFSNLSPELQFMNSVVTQLANHELEQKKLETKIDSIKDIVGTSTMDWRNATAHLITTIARQQGGATENYRLIRKDIYSEVDRRGGVSLKIRLTNLRRRMAEEGVTKSKRDKTNKIDVIAADKKLIEIYMAVVKDFAIKNGIWDEAY